jgi:hypothetical protein
VAAEVACADAERGGESSARQRGSETAARYHLVALTADRACPRHFDADSAPTDRATIPTMARRALGFRRPAPLEETR